MNTETQNKVLRLAAQICWMHGELAGKRTCQDWSADTLILDTLTPDEKNELMRQYEDYNSKGKDFEKDYFPYDEMLISFVVAHALELLATTSPQP